MLDAKKALEENGGDIDEAGQVAARAGPGQAAKRADREASRGCRGRRPRPTAPAAMVELRCETDFVAKSDRFVALVDELAALVAAKGEEAVAERATRSTTCASP